MIGPIIFSAVGILIVVLGVPLWRRRVRPNRMYGLRIRETLADEATCARRSLREDADVR